MKIENDSNRILDVDYHNTLLDITAVVLTFNEEIHIDRCLRNLCSFCKQVIIIDSFSTDRTLEIAKEYDATILQNKWENNYAKQFNWGLENSNIGTKWVLRLDADEYLTDDLINELKQKLPKLQENIAGVVFKRRHVFLGKWMKKGTYPVKLLRLFKNRNGICEQRLMDEHIQLQGGDMVEFDYDFVDHNLNDIGWWIAKHNGYAIREAVDLLDIEFNIIGNGLTDLNKELGAQASQKRSMKHTYVRMPLFWRSSLFFFIRYIVKGGFLEGEEGFLWHFLQGWWYRTLVDAKVFEIKKVCGSDKEKIVIYIKNKYNIDCKNQ